MSTSRFGGALEAALTRVVQSDTPDISVADAGTRAAFLDAWARTLSDHAKYLRANSEALKVPVVITYVSDTSTFGKNNAWNRHAMLRAAANGNLAGILAAGTGEVAAYVYPRRLHDTEDCEKVMRSVGLQLAPTIALMSESKLLVWPDGIDGDMSPLELSLDDAAIIVDHSKIDAELTIFYEGFARQTRKWWQDTLLRTTVESPEGAVQDDLRFFLWARNFAVAWIRAEEVIGNGRADITITPKPKKATGQSAVLELKTLRDVRTPRLAGSTPIKVSQKKNLVWALKGIQQAAAYRDHHDFDIAFLCLYDFCTGNSDAISKAVEPYAITYGVTPRRYWITASHEEHRENGYPIPMPVTRSQS